MRKALKTKRDLTPFYTFKINPVAKYNEESTVSWNREVGDPYKPRLTNEYNTTEYKQNTERKSQSQPRAKPLIIKY